MKKIITILALCLIIVLSAVGFAACGDDENTADNRDAEIVSIYNVYVAYAESNGTTPLSYEQWLASIKGEKGDQGIQGEKGADGQDGKDGIDGVDGKDGVTPTIEISEDCFWIINGTKTEIKAVGADGKNGVDGKDGIDGKDGADGAKGDKGDKGDTGAAGKDGVGVKSIAVDENGNLILTMTDDSVINAGKVKDVHPHELKTKEIIEKESTCTTTGVKYVVCETCGEMIKTVITDKAPHNYESKVTPATCTEKGYTTYTCKDCGYSYKDNYTEIVPHTYKDEITAPTCTEQGYTTHTCTVCGHKEIDTYTTADTNEHNYVAQGNVYGNCALSMKQDYKCSRCKNVKTETVTVQAPDAHNHLNEGETCPHCGWTLYTKQGDSLLMKNDKDQISAEFYGATTYDFGDALRKLYVRVYISDSVTSIGEYAFSNCSSLTSITIGGSVTSIGYRVFYYCSSLTSIKIPDSVTSIESAAFQNCYSLTSIYYPGTASEWASKIDGLYYIMSSGRTLYIDNKPLTNVVLENITIIKPYAFRDCSSLTSITIPDSVTSIGENAFFGCSSLNEITIPDSVTSIVENAFPSHLQETENGLIYVDKALIGTASTSGLPQTSYTIKEGTTVIAYGAFSRNSYVKTINLPSTLKHIGDYAFYHCSGLSEITISNNVTTIGNYAFAGGQVAYSVSYVEDTVNMSLTSVTMGNSVTSIGKGAFACCSNLTSITIPDSVANLSAEVFRGCTSLSSINLPESITSIGHDAFRDCSSLTSITLSNGVTDIEGSSYLDSGATGMFYGCSNLTTIIIPRSVTTIGGAAFFDCNSLNTIYYKGTKEEWQNIAINDEYNYYAGYNNANLTKATRYYYSETAPTETGNYWHYDTDGVTPVVWAKGN